MNYKDLSQTCLKNAIISTIEENEKYDPIEMNKLLNNLLANRKEDKFNDDDLQNLVEYLRSYSCNDALKRLIESEVPSFVLTYVVFYDQMYISTKRQFSRDDIKKISKNKQLERCLFLINEIFKVHDYFNYELITNEMLNSFFDIYEFSDSISSDFSISILTRFAEHSLDNLIKLDSIFFYKKRIMQKLKRKQTLSSIYAFFPFLKDESTYHNADGKETPIIEYLMYMQEDHKSNYEIFVPILQFYNIYMNNSSKSLIKAVSHQGINMIMSALETEVYENAEAISILKQTALEMLCYILESPFEEYKFIIIIEKDIFKTISLLLSRDHEKSEFDNITACQLLHYLLINNFINFSNEDCLDKIINNIIPLMYERSNESKYNIKLNIIKVYSALLQSGNESIISKIGSDGIFDDIIDSIENFEDETQLLILRSLFSAIKNFDMCMDFFDQTEAINVFSNLHEKSENLDVSYTSRSLVDFLSQ